MTTNFAGVPVNVVQAVKIAVKNIAKNVPHVTANGFFTHLFGDQIGYLLIGETTMECGLRSLPGALSSHEEPEVKRILQNVAASDFRPHPT